MELGYTLLITVVFTLMFILVQRTEATRRRITLVLTFIIGLLIRQNAFVKEDYHTETLVAFVASLVLSFLFWLLIGRYNPVGSSDSIQVMGMDD